MKDPLDGLVTGQADERLSIVAHDLRNPLSCIEGYTGILLNKDMPQAERAKLLQRILSCSRFMEQIIEDLLDTAAIERGELELKKGQVVLSELLRKSLDAMEHTATSRQVTLTLDAASADHPVLGDSPRIQQVVQNLVSNAIKHVEQGTGRVEVKVHDTDNELVIEVTDNGAGIAPEHIDHVFEKFFHADEDQRARGSLGLGLYIARQVVELHGGRLWVRSAGKGQGASFFFSIPKYQPEQAFQEYKALRRMVTPPPRRIGSTGRIPDVATLASINSPSQRSFVMKLAFAGALVVAVHATIWNWMPERPFAGTTYSASTAPLP